MVVKLQIIIAKGKIFEVIWEENITEQQEKYIRIRAKEGKPVIMWKRFS